MIPNRWRCEDCGHEHVAGRKGNVYVDGGLWCRYCVDRIGQERARMTGIGHMRKVTPWMHEEGTTAPTPYIPQLPAQPPPVTARTWPPPPAPRPPRRKQDPWIEVVCAWCRLPKKVRASQERVRKRLGHQGPFHQRCLSPYRQSQHRPASPSAPRMLIGRA